VGDKDAMQSLLEDCKTSSKKNKGVTSMWLLSENSMGVTMVAVQQGYLMVMQKNVVTKLESKFFKQYLGTCYKLQNVSDPTSLNPITTIVQYSNNSC